MPAGAGPHGRRACRLLATLAGLLGLTAAPAASGTHPTPVRCDETVFAGDYLLCLRVLHAGTRSEGRIGRLFRGGIEVPGRTVGETVEVTLPDRTVRFTWHGDARPRLWSNSGWSLHPLGT